MTVDGPWTREQVVEEGRRLRALTTIEVGHPHDPLTVGTLSHEIYPDVSMPEMVGARLLANVVRAMALGFHLPPDTLLQRLIAAGTLGIDAKATA